MQIRLSLGSATRLGLRNTRMDTEPTTLYAMLGEQCYGACVFCTQARDSETDRKFLSRIIWPTYDIDDVVERLREDDEIQRICIQTLKDPNVSDQILESIERLHAQNQKPISVCMNPVDRSFLVKLKNAGVERVGTGLDCATPESFAKIKPGFSWQQYQQFIADTVDIFGRGSVHLIVGLGDSDEELIDAFQRYTDMNCSIGLFALTLVRGTNHPYTPPPIERYRALQLARHIISQKIATIADMVFHNGKLSAIHNAQADISRLLSTGAPFRTSGCPSCNRPNYNERPGGTMYNYAHALDSRELQQAVQQLAAYISIE
jgi:biotin synthase-related radical SAM superfamily protein